MSARSSEVDVAAVESAVLNPQAALKDAAHRLAIDHEVVDRLNVDFQSLSDLGGYRDTLKRAHGFFLEPEGLDPAYRQAGEWLLDNFYVVTSALREIEQDMPPDFYRQLPRLLRGETRGYPRIYLIAREMLKTQAVRLRMDGLKQFAAFYQQIVPLQMGELWALPTMLRFNLIEQLTRSLADLTDSREKPPKTETVEDVQTVEHIVPWCILGLRMLETQDWKIIFEELSLVDQALAADPAGVYEDMTFETRDAYRKVIERLSRNRETNEVDTAMAAVSLARQAGADEPAMKRHVGYYLVDDGLKALEDLLSYRPVWHLRLKRWWLQDHPVLLYLGLVFGLSFLLSLVPFFYAYRLAPTPAQIVISSVLLVVPLLTMAVSLGGWLMNLVTAPRVLPKLDFEDGVPSDCRTMVVVPTLLTNSPDVTALLQQLELHYLRNQDPNITFALLTDFCDSLEQDADGDQALLGQAIEGIRSLNQKYERSEDRGAFYLFHRKRLWNAAEGTWMGWERKRGKLEEFNRLLLGDDTTSFAVRIGDADVLPSIRYIITLDSDTMLPHGQAHRLVGTMAHPLNQAYIDHDRGTVTSGYAILQPRVEVKPTSANRSIFSRIFSGQNGIDLYSIAVSDMYQDLLGEGVFIGKGIYDVAAFHRCMADRVPENTLLSHDLFEGLFCRAGFVSDVILYEEFPPSCQAYVRRAHRWIRGDWQLLPWLLPRVPHGRGGRVRNVLRLIDRWKVMDNLRRSLVRPALLTLLLAGWLWLPGSSLFWTALAVLTMASELLSNAMDLLRQKVNGRGRFVSARILARPFWRWLLELVILPYEALTAGDAIFRVLLRIFVTRKGLLQWTAAAQTNRLLGRNRKLQTLLGESLPAFFLSLSLAIVLGIYNRPGLLAASPLLLAWLAGPLIMLRISRPAAPAGEMLKPDQVRQLRGLTRRTWYFFEKFIGPQDHWLAPDHFQEQPLGLVAHRTSPTNIGLMLLSTLAAYDMGYLGLPELQVRLKNSLENLEKLERFHGHFLNWYDTSTLAPLPPRYISTVDSGNLAGCLVALRQSCLAARDIRLPRLIRREGFLDTLSILNEILSRCIPDEPELARALLAEVDGMAAQVAGLGKSPQDWTRLLNRFIEVEWPRFDTDLVALVNEGHLTPTAIRSIRVWAERSRYQLLIMQRKAHRMMPWLSHMSAPPALLLAPGVEEALPAAWRALNEAVPLDAVPTSRIPLICRAVKMRLETLAETLSAVPADAEARGEALKWCDDFGQSLAIAEQEVSALLSAFSELAVKLEQMIREMDFAFLYNRERGVFHIGYNVDRDALDGNYYDLLASEARLASLFAIAKGDVPEKHWLYLGRPLTQTRKGRTLLSWSGTMFEYLMPGLLVRHYPNTLLAQSIDHSIDRQIEYGMQKGVPWGISESGYFRFDAAQHYQYRAFGVPGLGFKRGLGEDLVVSPYASLLALPFRPDAVMKNIADLVNAEMLGDYGFYEAIDYTSNRLAMGEKSAIVRSFMVHHQGMIMLALVNALLDDTMVRRFHADPQIRSIELLLQEGLPGAAPAVDLHGDGAAMVRRIQVRKEIAAWPVPVDTPYPQVHYLSNGRYGVMISNSGAGYSCWNDVDLTRWRADTTRDDWGTWLYIQDVEEGVLWSATPQPVCNDQARWEVNFAPHQVEFHCAIGHFTSDMHLTVSAEDDVEIRRLRLTNHGPTRRRLQVTSYGELVMGDQNGDRRHPAFNKLFMESEFQAENGMLIFRRRPRKATETPLFLAHALVNEKEGIIAVRWETARDMFLRRGGSPRCPGALAHGANGLTGSTGTVLDPVMCLQVELEIEPQGTAEVVFLTAAAGSKQQLSGLVAEYRQAGHIEQAFRRANSQCEVQFHQLDLTSEKVARYQQLLSLLLYPHAKLRAPAAELAANRSGQSGLWPFAVSGDFPILLVRLFTVEELGMLREVLQAYRYWRLRGLKIDLVIQNEQGISYDHTLQQKLVALLEDTRTDQWFNQRGGIFIIQAERLSPEERALFSAAARLVLDGRAGDLARQLAEGKVGSAWPPLFVPPRFRQAQEPTPPLARPTGLVNDNGWGGFDADGREYVIYLQPGEQTPAPWINVISNPDFGFIVSENGSSCTWAANSGENRLTPWFNDPVRDPSGEAIYIRDEATGVVWSPAPQPVPSDLPYLVRHGAGYTVFEHNSFGILQRLRLFVDKEAPVKLAALRLANTWSQPRVLTVTYYCEWVLGVNRDQTQQYLIPEYDGETGALLAVQPYQEEFGRNTAFLAAGSRPDKLTADRAEFIGRLGELERPAALRRLGLTGRVEAGTDPCAVLQLSVHLEAGESREIHFMLGQGRDREEALALVRRFKSPEKLAYAWQTAREAWDQRLGIVQVETPDIQMDLMLNRWLLYQNLACRIWGRSAFYQSSGAFGFRDQLQDVMGVLHADPGEARRQILRAAGRQFREGDVLHWWHPPSGRGVRTRISDDLLWLPFVTSEYLAVTQDESILQENVRFLEAPPLMDDEDERYSHYEASGDPVRLYTHCIKAIERADRCGRHELPLMGGGDWNDGLNRVGIEGEGESVWLGFFLYATLDRFIPICARLGDQERADRFRERMRALRIALEDHAWDGEWYLRAFYDDGLPLGSRSSDEYRISSIAQSWAVLSGASGGQRSQQAIHALLQHLVRSDEQLALLFAPPFNETRRDPGYIKGYPPGIRENGGQYTHAATWAAWACAKLGRGSDAHRLFRMLNPAVHADTPEKATLYRVEPYVVAADIYGVSPHIGRGGWTWYTGSAGWLYRLGLEAILGLRRRGDVLQMSPCIPETWSGYRLSYRFGEAKYRIEVANPARLNQGVEQVRMDGRVLPEGDIPLIDDGLEHVVEVVMGRSVVH